MGIDRALQKHGYEFEEEYSDSNAPAEIWINEEIGWGIRIEWFMLEKLKRCEKEPVEWAVNVCPGLCHQV